MKVSDLIAHSVFTPGGGRSSAESPRVTIILPTFRRGDNGLLGRAIDSLLAQSFSDFELIVVDDASTDSTTRVVADAMARDPRVSVIRHERNIGLPAVSEYEAYVLARGSLISFAFDDTVFARHGLRTLVRASERHPGSLIAGWVNMFYRHADDGSIRVAVLGAGATEADLMTRNVIPNGAVLAPTSLLDVVGLFDPHISLARLCDYDLWLRVRRRFPIHFVDACIGEEHGPSVADSLGSTYPLDHWLSDDRIRQRRDDLLTPARFAELDVFDASAFPSARSRAVVASLVERHLETHPWMARPTEPTGASRVPRIFVLASPIDTSLQLSFEALRDLPGAHVRIIEPWWRTVSELAEADALIVPRPSRDSTDWIAVARLSGIPVFCYLHDLDESEDADEAEHDFARLRRDLGRLDGVITSTDDRAQRFGMLGLHPTVIVAGPAVPGVVADWRRAPARAPEHPPTVALLFPAHRLGDLRQTIWPALVEAAESTGQRVRLLVPSTATDVFRRLPGRDRVEVTPFPASADYFSELRALDELGVDVLAAPHDLTADGELTTPQPLVSAAILGAALLASGAGPLRELAGFPGVTLVGAADGHAEWGAAFARAITAAASSPHESWSVPAELLTSRFDPAAVAQPLLTELTSTMPAGEADEHTRLRRIIDWFSRGVGHAQHGTPTATDPSADIAVAAQSQAAVRRSRRAQLPLSLRTAPLSPYVGFPDEQNLPGRNVRIELSHPLTGLPYISYRMSLPLGRFRRIRAMLWADASPGDLVGIEIVDPAGQIKLHTVALLPQADRPIPVALDARGLLVEEEGLHEVRVFVLSHHLAYLLERVDRGRLGLRRPAVTPVIRFEQ